MVGKQEEASMTPVDISSAQLARRAAVYVRQSTLTQVAENLESQRRQYALTERAVALGWQRAHVLVIDDDLGVSGSGVARTGFDRLVAEVGLGNIGIIFAIEVSRLARNNRDWYHLLDLCAMVDTLIGDSDGLYHPGVFNDRLLLGLKGTMSEVELHLIRSRLQGGLWEAARRGELRTHLPIGFEHDPRGAIVITPDEAVRETVALVFRKFAELGSARQVVAHLAEEGIRLPHRDLRDGRVTWRAATYPPVHRILSNPIYAGMYAYGRSKIERRLDEQGRIISRQHLLPESEWNVRLENHHPGYISYENYLANREQLRSNWPAPKEDGGRAVREGAALLQGLIRCGKCGRRMQVTYTGPGGKTRRYACHQSHRLQAAEHACQSLGGVRLDKNVAEVFLDALAPASLEATLAALRETEQAWVAERNQRELQVEAARYETERARRQFDRVEPENRLVARTLERQWEKRLEEQAAREQELARFQAKRPVPLDEQEITWLRGAGADLRSVWLAESTSHRERKQLIRCLINEVVVTIHRERGEAEVTVAWVGGASTTLTSRLNRTGEHQRVTSEKVIDLVRRLAPGHTNDQIAFILNSKRLRTGHGNSFTRLRVALVRERLGIPSPKPRHRADVEDPTWMDVNSTASELGVSPDTIRRWAREGFLEARQLMPQAPWRVHVTDEVRQRVVPNSPPGWVGLAEAARALQRSKQTILHWVQSGRLRAVQVTSGKRKGLRIELEREAVGLFAGQ
jgi:DNA invertase Pin-like site-specific DNA recombinase